MNITSKFLYAKTKDAFIRELPNIPPTLKPIVFIEDTKELWTHGTYFSIGYPSIKVSEISGTVKVEVGDDNFILGTSGSSLSITKGIGNNIIISSTALTSINTEAPLNWSDSTKKLTHLVSGITAGNFGQTSNTNNASIFSVPNITVDKYGHVTSAQSVLIAIRDYVEQLSPSSTDSNRNILLAYNTGTDSDTGQVRKARGLFYNDASQFLTIGGGLQANGDVTVNDGNLTVIGGMIIGDLQGNVTGQATPKIHLSDIPEYGGASTELYGHVKLQDELTSEPLASSTNTDKNSAVIINGVAASPKMVWDVKQAMLVEITSAPSIGGFVVGDTTLEINTHNQQVTIAGQNGIQVSIADGGLIVKGIDTRAYDENGNETTITETLTYSKDFILDSEKNLWIRWEEFN